MDAVAHPQGVVCFTNKDQISFILKSGVYGNVSSGDISEKQSSQGFSRARQTRFGKLTDLFCTAPGHLVFLFEREESVLHGVWRISSNPFFSTSRVFEPGVETYPYRFLMQPHLHFPEPVQVMELRKLLDRNVLWSIRSFERDQLAPFASVKPISAEETQALLSLFYRYNHRFDPRITPPEYPHIPLTSHINFHDLVFNDVFAARKNFEIRAADLGNTSPKMPLEHALHCLIGYNLTRHTPGMVEVFGRYDQVLREVPISVAGQQSVDFLLMYRSPVNGNPTVYSLIEVKRGNVPRRMLGQLLEYMKLFSERHKLDSNAIEGIYIGSGFDSEAMKYVVARAEIEKTERRLRLIKYVVHERSVVLSEIQA